MPSSGHISQFGRKSITTAKTDIPNHRLYLRCLKTITTIPDYCIEVNIPQPKYAFFDVRRFEDKVKTENSKQSPFRHEFYAIGLRHSGENREVNGQRLQANLFFNSPYQVISWDVLPDWKGWYILFDKDFVTLNPAWKNLIVDFPFFQLDQSIPFDLPEADESLADNLMEKIHTEYHSSNRDKFQFIISYTQLLLLLTKRYFLQLNIGNDTLHSNRTADILLVSRFQVQIETAMADNNATAAVRQPAFYASSLNVHPVFMANDQAAVLKITGVLPNVSPWGRAIDFTTFRAAGAFFIDNLNAFNDPRLPKFASQARATSGTTTIGYKGIPSGYDGNGQFNYLPSNLLVALATAPMISVIMPYAEVEFIKAEVELHFNKEAEAKAAYEKGVKAAIEQWGAIVPANYFSNPAAAYNGTLERIMLQKYYGSFFNDYQSWFEYRRTGFPVLPKTAAMLNNGVMPVRFKYPPTIQATNPENFKKAVTSMGGDDINVKVWWEK